MKAGPKIFKKLPRPHGPWHVSTQCTACDGEMETQWKNDIAELKDESLPITYECQVCKNCGFAVMSVPQLGARVRTTTKAYQKKHGLLTADEIRHRRLALGYQTQQALSDAAPNIAIATLKRLEGGWHMQDTATDILLRRELHLLEENQKLKQQIKFFQETPWLASRNTRNANAESYTNPTAPMNTTTTSKREEAFAL